MAGEMSREEVTRENYPDLFKLKAALSRRGVKSEAKPFDQYQGPYLYIPGVGKAWYAATPKPLFILETHENGKLRFLTSGALFVEPATEKSYECGVYDFVSAAKVIAGMANRGTE